MSGAAGAVPPGGGRTEHGAGPRRRCFATRRVADRATLIRFVVAPGGDVVPDVAGKLAGRGLWLSADRNVINTACTKSLFGKGFRSSVVVGDKLADRVESLLARRCMEFLGLARRAGEAAVGFEKVRALVAAEAAAVLVTACDAGADGRRKLSGAAKTLPVVSAFSAAELAAALGREHTVYVALKKGRLAGKFVAEARRLAGFRMDPERNGDGPAINGS